MEKKLIEWDKMMDKDRRTDERARSLDEFRLLSDQEVDLATTEVSRKQLKELIDVKLDCFDMLARETDASRRCDGIKKFQQVCDNELSLAKALGPRQLQRQEENAREDRLAKQREKAEEEKRRTAEKQTQASGVPQMVPGTMLDGMSFPATMRGRRMSLFPGMFPEEQAKTAKREFTMEQRLNAPVGAETLGTQMYPRAPPRGPDKPNVGPDPLRMNAADPSRLPREESNLTYDQLVAAAVSLLPKSSSSADVKKEAERTTPEKATEGKNPDVPDCVIDKKLKLLTTLDAARGVLQNYVPGSSGSMDEEVRKRLRKIQRLQVKVVDEILGSKADFNSEIPSEIQLEKSEEEKFRRRTSVKDGPTKDEESRFAARQLKEKYEVAKRIILHLPDLNDTRPCVVSASVSSVQLPVHDKCSGKSEHCPIQDDSRPEILWERPVSDTKTFEPSRSSHSPDKGCDYLDGSQPFVSPETPPPYLHCEHHLDVYSDMAPHYHNESLSSNPAHLHPPRDAYYPAPTFSAQTYPLYYPNHHAPQPSLPPELDVVNSCNIAYDLEYEEPANVGVGTDTGFPVDSYDDVGQKKQDVFSETTIIIQVPEKTAEAEVPNQQTSPQQVQPQAKPSPAQPQPAQAALTQAAPTPDSPVLVAPAGVAPVQAPLVSQPTQVLTQTVEVKGSSSDDRRFMNLCQDSLARIAASVDGIVNSLSYRSSEDTRGRRRRRRQRSSYAEQGYYGDEDDDDDGFSCEYYDEEYYEYDDPPTPRPRRRRSRPKAPRRRASRKLPLEGVDSVLGLLCRSIRTPMYESSSFMTPNNARLAQVAERIRQLVQAVVVASREVIAARNMMQRGHMGTQDIFAAESKLWNLIRLETQLANELSQYRMLDTQCSETSFQRLAHAEEKIRRLIDVETRLATEMSIWRQGAQQPAALSTTYAGSTMYNPSGYVNSSSSTMTPGGVLTPSTSTTSAYTL